MKELLQHYSKTFDELRNNPMKAEACQMPGDAYFIDGNTILTIPRDDGDSRYPYGKDGFNFWTYASGYMHCNEGLYSPILRASEGGAEPKVAFFAAIGGEPMFSLLSVPVVFGTREDILRYTVFTMSATYYVTETPEAIFGVRAFVDKARNMYFTLEVVNKTVKALDIKLSTYFNPFIKNAMMENSTDRWFRVVEYIEEKSCFKVEAYEERDRLGMATNYGILSRVIDEETLVQDVKVTTSRYDYVGGARSSLHSAKVLQDGDIKEEKKKLALLQKPLYVVMSLSLK